MTTRALQTLLGHFIFSLCFPLVILFTCFEFVYISFYFQISQEKIKPSLLTQRTVSRGQRGKGICRVVVWNIFILTASLTAAVSDHWYILRIVGSLIYCAIPAEVSANYLTYVQDCTLNQQFACTDLLWFVLLFFFFDLQLVRWCIWGSWVMLICWQE